MSAQVLIEAANVPAPDEASTAPPPPRGAGSFSWLDAVAEWADYWDGE